MWLLEEFNHIYDPKDPLHSLHCAICHGYYLSTKFLLECGVSPNQKNTKCCNETALHVIASGEIDEIYEKILKLLIKFGARSNLKNSSGKTALVIMRSRCITKDVPEEQHQRLRRMIRMMEKCSKPIDPKHSAAVYSKQKFKSTLFKNKDK